MFGWRMAHATAVGAAVLITLGSAGAAHGATVLDGTYTGAGHALRISGTLEGGFTISAAESWMVIGCPIPAGTVLTRFTPSGNGTYTASYLWTEATTTQGQEGVQCENSYREESGITITRDGRSLEFSGCGSAFCATVEPAGPPPRSDTKPPVVHAFNAGWAYPGSPKHLPFSVKDDSGRATVTLTLYSGGQQASTLIRTRRAAGSRDSLKVPMPAGATGPMYFCMFARDAAGNVSARAPLSDCGWISLVVDVTAVSNGCGGAFGETAEKVQNWLMDRQTYKGFEVNFRPACNLHDAGYGGYSVIDRINGHEPVDFRTRTREEIDQKLRADMQTLCERSIRGDSKRARLARLYCTRGLTLTDAVAITILVPGSEPPGARAYYEGVRAFAQSAFDTDLMRPETQAGPPSSVARRFGGARDNG